MFLGINSIYTPVYLPLGEYGQNQPPCADVGLLLNMALTRSFHSLVWAILRSNPPSLHVGWFFKIYPSDALGVYFPIYTPRSIYRSVYLIIYINTWHSGQSFFKRTASRMVMGFSSWGSMLCKVVLFELGGWRFVSWLFRHIETRFPKKKFPYCAKYPLPPAI